MPPPTESILLEDPTKDYYEEYALEYFKQTSALNLQPLWSKLSQHIEPNAFILDLGCGSGRDVRYFAVKGFEVIGLDYAARLLKLARDTTQQPLVLADFNFLPFLDNSFDAVWAIGSLLHTPRQFIPYVLAQIHRILKAEGILFTSVKKGYGEKIDSHGRYNVFYLGHEWENILRENAYDVVETEENVEIRETKSGQSQELTWITCITRAI